MTPIRLGFGVSGLCGLALVVACSGRVQFTPQPDAGAAGQGAAGQGWNDFGTAGAPVTSVGGAPSSSGGSVAYAGAVSYAGSSSIAGGAGSVGSAGSAGVPSGGAQGTAGVGTGGFPACTTQTKGGACTVEGDTCLKTCGPERVGVKAETCMAGVYIEGNCTFNCADTAIDWSCFAGIAQAPACSTGTQASTPCFLQACLPCAGVYLDASGAEKIGGCVCAGTAGAEKWSCAALVAWPMCQ